MGGYQKVRQQVFPRASGLPIFPKDHSGMVGGLGGKIFVLDSQRRQLRKQLVGGWSPGRKLGKDNWADTQTTLFRRRAQQSLPLLMPWIFSRHREKHGSVDRRLQPARRPARGRATEPRNSSITCRLVFPWWGFFQAERKCSQAASAGALEALRKGACSSNSSRSPDRRWRRRRKRTGMVICPLLVSFAITT